MHGGNIYFTDQKLIDFSANINPLGVPESVRTAILNALPEIVHYPDPEQKKLTKAIAAFHRIAENMIICGNGGADVLFRTIQAIRPEHALLPVPTFSEYEKSLTENHCHITRWIMPDLCITEDLIAELEKNRYDFLVLCSPNNPTGICISPDLLIRILETAKQRQIFVLLDECFYDMTENLDSMLSQIDRFSNLLILKSLTKFYALPGLRLGYGICSDADRIRKIRKIGQPWPVNTLASAAGCAALADDSFQNRFHVFLKSERDFLYQELKKMAFQIWPPSANYIFFQIPDHPELDRELLRDGILIRSCDNYPGLDHSYYRIAVRTHEENLYFLDCLKKIIR